MRRQRCKKLDLWGFSRMDPIRKPNHLIQPSRKASAHPQWIDSHSREIGGSPDWRASKRRGGRASDRSTSSRGHLQDNRRQSDQLRRIRASVCCRASHRFGRDRVVSQKVRARWRLKWQRPIHIPGRRRCIRYHEERSLPEIQ